MTADHPILFSAPMIRALLAGTKSQTRRIVRFPSECFAHGRQPCPDRSFVNRGLAGPDEYLSAAYGGGDYTDPAEVYARVYARMQTGDRLWVRETWRTEERDSDAVDGIRFRADDAFVPIANTKEAADAWVAARPRGAGPDSPQPDPWRPSIFMPRWASRLSLEVTRVRVERVQSITEEDARAEGVGPVTTRGSRAAYAKLWDSINGRKAAWSANPWCFVIDFRVVKP